MRDEEGSGREGKVKKGVAGRERAREGGDE